MVDTPYENPVSHEREPVALNCDVAATFAFIAFNSIVTSEPVVPDMLQEFVVEAINVRVVGDTLPELSTRVTPTYFCFQFRVSLFSL